METVVYKKCDLSLEGKPNPLIKQNIRNIAWRIRKGLSVRQIATTEEKTTKFRENSASPKCSEMFFVDNDADDHQRKDLRCPSPSYATHKIREAAEALNNEVFSGDEDNMARP